MYFILHLTTVCDCEMKQNIKIEMKMKMKYKHKNKIGKYNNSENKIEVNSIVANK